MDQSFLPSFMLYLNTSSIRPCMEYFCYVWTGAPNYFLKMVQVILKQVCKVADPAIASSLEPLAHRRNWLN